MLKQTITTPFNTDILEGHGKWVLLGVMCVSLGVITLTGIGKCIINSIEKRRMLPKEPQIEVQGGEFEDVMPDTVVKETENENCNFNC